MTKIAKQFDIGIILEPQSTDPVSPKEGQIQRADGSSRTAGLWEYKNSQWVFLLADTTLGDVNQNYIINGDLSIAQRGTSVNSLANNAYTMDRYIYNKSGAGVHNSNQNADVPPQDQTGYAFQNSIRLQLTTADNSIAAGDLYSLNQYIEGINFATLHKKMVTLSFWVKADLIGIYCVSFSNSASNRSYVTEYNINVANTWEYKTISLTLDASGTWLFDSNIGLKVGWTLAAGTNYQTTADSWQSGDFRATSNQVNGTATGATFFFLTGVKLNLGGVATPFSLFGGDISGEVSACRRYYQKSYPLGTAAASITTNGQVETRSNATSTAAGYGWFQIRFPVTMRATPTMTTYSPATGTPGKLRDVDGVVDVDSTTSGTGDSGTNIVNNAAFGAVSRRISVQYVANAEL